MASRSISLGITGRSRISIADASRVSKVLLALLFISYSGSSPAQGLKLESPPAVLNDPKVLACRLLAAPGMDSKLENEMSAVEYAAARFEVVPVLKAVAACREALLRYPEEPDVVVGEYSATEALKTLLFGYKHHTKTNAELLQLALKEQSALTESSVFRSAYNFYIASSY